MNKKLIIRADAGKCMGTGHIMRCIALAQVWQDQGGDVTFLSYCDCKALHQRIINEGFDFIAIEKPHPDPSDLTQTLNILKRHAPCSMPHALWFVMDGYHFTPDYHKAIRKNGYRLLVIDDTAHLDHYHADILLNQNIYASSLRYSCDRDTVKLLGCEYILLRREFLKYKDWKRDISDKAKKILVTMGGADLGNETLKVMRALSSLNDPDFEVKIVAGPSNPNKEILINATRHAPCSMLCVENASNMAELMAWADMAISAGGSTCWEIAFMGLPSLIITAADNQVGIAKGLENASAAINLGWHNNISTEQYSRVFEEVFQGSDKRSYLSKKGQKLINGKGVVEIIKAMIEKQINLRRAQENDCELLWKWANDAETREASFSSALIPWEDHIHWFDTKLNSVNCMMFVATIDDGTLLGQIRYEIKQENVVISISIDRKFRGTGYGTVLLRKASKRLFNESNVRRVHAYVKQDNRASARVFSKAGFKKLELTTIHAQRAIHFVLERFTS